MMLIWHKLKLNIQHKAGTVRSGRDAAGNPWSQLLPYDYGEIVGSEGIDGEPVDVIVGNYLKSDKVFICQMPKNKSGEDKVLIGFLTSDQAKKAFIACYGGNIAFLKKIKSMSVKMFKLLLRTKPGKSLIASFYDGTYVTNIGALEPVPTGWNTKVDNPGDKKLTKEERRFNTDLALRQGKPEYATTSQVARTTSVDNVY